jgi:hypothetical protein
MTHTFEHVQVEDNNDPSSPSEKQAFSHYHEHHQIVSEHQHMMH